MIKREVYMQRIRPFMNTELIKVFTGIRRAGKSMMLELVKEELKNSGVDEKNFLCMNFEVVFLNDADGGKDAGHDDDEENDVNCIFI